MTFIEEKLKEFEEKFPVTQCVTPAYAFKSDSVTVKQVDLESFLKTALEEAYNKGREDNNIKI